MKDICLHKVKNFLLCKARLGCMPTLYHKYTISRFFMDIYSFYSTLCYLFIGTLFYPWLYTTRQDQCAIFQACPSKLVIFTLEHSERQEKVIIQKPSKATCVFISAHCWFSPKASQRLHNLVSCLFLHFLSREVLLM